MGCVSSNFADGVAPSPSAIKQGAHTPAMLVNKSRSKVDVQVSPKDASTTRKRSKGHAVSTSSTAASVLDQSDYKQTSKSKIAGTETYQAVYTDPNGNNRGGVATQFLVQPSPESEPEKKPGRMAGLFRRSKKAPSPTATPKANDIATRIRRRKKKGKCVEDDYQLTRQIGKGHYGYVYEAIDKRTRDRVAVKILNRATSKKERLQLEVSIMQRLAGHPGVVQLYDVYETGAEVQLVMEYVRGGELFERLVDKGPYDEFAAARLIRGLTETLQFMHENGVVHRDLKPENILLSSRRHEGQLKLSDFGLSRYFEQDNELMKTVCGTWAYSAPEVKLIRKHYSRSVDMWSLGVLIYVMLGGYHPFDPEGDAADAVLQQNIKDCKFDFDDPNWDKVSDLAKHMIQNLLQLDPSKRLTTYQLLSHPWIVAHTATHTPRRTSSQRLTDFHTGHPVASASSVSTAVGASSVSRSGSSSSSSASTAKVECVTPQMAASKISQTPGSVAEHPEVIPPRPIPRLELRMPAINVASSSDADVKKDDRPASQSQPSKSKAVVREPERNPAVASIQETDARRPGSC